jgi:hypothetical protein
MRIPIVLVAAALTLAACGARQPRLLSVEPQTSGSVRLYASSMPRCQFRELGYVTGRRADDIKSAAFAMRANAVLLEPAEPNSRRSGGPYAGTAIQFLSANCRR